MFKFDTHVHTSEVSPCGHVGAVETVKLYLNAGYSGLCITDHYKGNIFDKLSCNSWEDKMNWYLQGYRLAKEYGAKNGFDVLIAPELTLDGSTNDLLLFGATEEFLFDYPELYKYDIGKLKGIAQKKDILIFQAHPFRPRMTREDKSNIDGVEVVNGNPRHDSQNDLALEFALQSNLLVSGGSDCHQTEDVGKSGIITKSKIKNNRDLLKALRSGCIEVIQA